MPHQVITRQRFPGQSPFPSPIVRKQLSRFSGPFSRRLGALVAGIVLWLGSGLLSTPSWSLSGKPVSINGPIGLQPVGEHTFTKPVFLTTSPEQSDLFVVEQGGRIIRLTGRHVHPTPFLDIGEKLSTGGERGLLGLAFHPRYSSNGRFVVNYTRAEDGATVIAEYRVSPDRNKADPHETVRLVIPQPYRNHNGGMVAFGPDELLYIGMGDGGSGGDPENRAQNREELLGKLLRIDVDGLDGREPYRIPPDNPFVGRQGKPEIFALGLRNPWRFSFDRHTGELWAGDVGQHLFEEIDVIAKGKNYGWRMLEGKHCFNPEIECHLVPDLVDPMTEYRHEQGRCSVTGGYVYRGTRIPAFGGTYLFGDFCSGEIWGYRNGQTSLLLDTDLQISSFGEDREGELYVIGHEGSIMKIVPKSVKLSD